MSSAPVWTLDVFGPPRLVGPQGPRKIDRRTAVLLAYLALEGPQPRSRISALLWPDVRDQTARANLRQLVHRLREATTAELVDGADPMALTSAIAVDVRRLIELERAGAHAEVLRVEGRLLDGVVLEDSDELDDWITRMRDQLDRVRRDAALAESQRLEAGGEWAAAIAAAQRAVDIDPISEPAHRQLMKTHYLAGDRAAASAAYARCRVVLRDRLQVEPPLETTRLADEIARARRPGPRSPVATPHIPISVLRPPVLAGREREWAAMEAAWQRGQSIVIGGSPGIGKSRLMAEFLATHAPAIACSGRPGDRGLPYGTHARTYREMLAVIGRDALPDWVTRELARLMPELGEAPGPLASPPDRLRFWSAKIEVHRIAFRLGYTAFGLDDLQYVDEASTEAGAYILAQLRGDPQTPIQSIHCYRTGELPPQTMAFIRMAASAGALLHLELEPLAASAVGELLSSLEIPGLEAVGPEIARYAGGTPMFILETVKHLVETNGLASGRQAPIALGGHARTVLAARLDRLSPAALELARLLSIFGTEFSLARAGEALDVAPTTLGPAWEELVAAQLVRGDAFAHDLIAEAVDATMPEPVRRLLHRRVAEALDGDPGVSAQIATHWLEAGEPARASERRRQAFVESRTTLLPDEAERYFGDAPAR
jgi:DNA-binding SARP family transcriptional activator